MRAVVTLSLPTEARYVGVMRILTQALLARFDVPRPVVTDIELAVGEACANVIRHAAGSEAYSLTLTVHESGCEVEVADLGPGFPIGVSTRSADWEAEMGRGLHLMTQLVDDLQLLRTDNTTRVLLRKRWRAGRSSGESLMDQ